MLYLILRRQQNKHKKVWSSELHENYGIKLRIQNTSDQQESRWDHRLGETVTLPCYSLTCFGSQSCNFNYDSSLMLIRVQNAYVAVVEKLLACKIPLIVHELSMKRPLLWYCAFPFADPCILTQLSKRIPS